MGTYKQGSFWVFMTYRHFAALATSKAAYPETKLQIPFIFPSEKPKGLPYLLQVSEAAQPGLLFRAAPSDLLGKVMSLLPQSLPPGWHSQLRAVTASCTSPPSGHVGGQDWVTCT